MVLNSASSAGGPQIFAPMERWRGGVWARAAGRSMWHRRQSVRASGNVLKRVPQGVRTEYVVRRGAGGGILRGERTQPTRKRALLPRRNGNAAPRRLRTAACDDPCARKPYLALPFRNGSVRRREVEFLSAVVAVIGAANWPVQAIQCRPLIRAQILHQENGRSSRRAIASSPLSRRYRGLRELRLKTSNRRRWPLDVGGVARKSHAVGARRSACEGCRVRGAWSCANGNGTGSGAAR